MTRPLLQSSSPRSCYRIFSRTSHRPKMIWDQRQRHLAVCSLAELGFAAEQVLLFCPRSLTMEQPAFSMNLLLCFLVFLSSSRTRGRVTMLLCISHDRTNGWLGGRTGNYNDDGKVYLHTQTALYLSTTNLPTRHMSKWSEWQRAFPILVLSLARFHSKRVGGREREREVALEITLSTLSVGDRLR